MPITRRSATNTSATKTRDDDPYEDEDDEDEPDSAPARRGLGKRIRGSAEAAFKSGVAEGSQPADDDEDEDDEPTGSAVKRGWAAAQRAKAASSGFAEEFKFTEEEVLIRFLEDEPFAVFAQHWIDGLTSTKKKSFICLGKGCPLCAIGDNNPRPQFAFNVALLDQDVEPKVLLAGTRLLGQIENAHKGKQGPLAKGYWAISKTGKKQTTAYVLQAVKPRDLEEDWDIDVAEVEKQIAKLKRYDDSAYKPMTRAQLKELADELLEDD